MFTHNIYKKVFFTICILIACIFAFPVFAAKWYENYQEAEYLMEREGWIRAIELLKQAIDEEPEPGERKRTYGVHFIEYYPYLKLGEAYLETRDSENARRYCEKAQEKGEAPKKKVEQCLTKVQQAKPTPTPARPSTSSEDVMEKGTEVSLPELVQELFGTSRSWAVVIGIDTYSEEKNGYQPLLYAVRDTNAIKEYLIGNLGFSEDRIFTLLDAQATKNGIERLLGDNLPGKLTEEDRLLIYFSGHGETRTLASGENYGYLVPVDGRKEALHSTCISMSQLSDYSELIPAQQILFIIDACYSGIAGIIKKGVEGDLSATTEAQIRRFMESRGRQIMTAGASNEKAHMGKKWDDHSVYTYYLLRGLKGEADYNEDRVISTLELQVYLNTKVSQATNRKQNPQLHYLDVSEGQFIFYREGEL